MYSAYAEYDGVIAYPAVPGTEGKAY